MFYRSHIRFHAWLCLTSTLGVVMKPEGIRIYVYIYIYIYGHLKEIYIYIYIYLYRYIYIYIVRQYM